MVKVSMGYSEVTFWKGQCLQMVEALAFEELSVSYCIPESKISHFNGSVIFHMV